MDGIEIESLSQAEAQKLCAKLLRALRWAYKFTTDEFCCTPPEQREYDLMDEPSA